MTQSEKADKLRALHHGPDILLLPNAWDCASARIIEAAGYPAIATTSAGIAFSLGYPDGQRIRRDEMLAVVRRIARCVAVPVTADLEAGYEDITATAAGMVEAGAVGLNLEDASGDPAELVRKIAGVRRAGHDLGVNTVINARMDLYLNNAGDPATRFDRACERLRVYREAGADCLFIPGVTGEETIQRFVEALRFPLNFLAGPGTPPVQRLRELGVARLSLGSGVARAAMGLTRRIAQELRSEGTYDAMLRGAVPYAEANQLFEK